MIYAEVVLPLALNKNLTYIVPDELADKAGVGYRVIVPLGRRNKFYTGIVVSLSTVNPTPDFELKNVEALLDTHPIVIYPQLKLWEWISDYYLCSEGDVMKAALPSALKIESETMVELSHDAKEESVHEMELTERESIITAHLVNKGAQTISELQKDTGLKNIAMAISGLIEKGLVVISERINERFHSKKMNYLRLSAVPDTENVARFFSMVKGAPNQERMLQFMVGYWQKKRNETESPEISRKEFLEITGQGVSALDALVKKGILLQYKKEINRFGYEAKDIVALPKLSAFQSNAFVGILNTFKEKDIVLFRGVTSSGKTEIYQHLIDEALQNKAQALFLVPEIALTTQLTRRLQSVFGNKVIIYHSKFSDSERAEIWLRMLKKKEPCVIIGARSSVFLPFFNLKLVVVDEEHEGSYKQADPAPRYNARDVAIVLAAMHGAKTLLGSATPSVESFWKAQNGKFGYVELLQRYNNAPLPPIEVVNMTENYKSKRVSGAFALKTLKRLQQTLDEGKQAIVFQNRRGYAPVARCKMCAWSPKCDRCDVALTYHKDINSLVCHYCGNVYPMPGECPQCKEPAVEISGFGTERLEEEIEMRMPGIKIARLDLDTTRNKDSYAKIIDDFSEHKTDMLVGTQMVTKGLDFGDVKTVVVTNADAMLSYPDFRATERAFNMLEQVGGRAGRKDADDSRVIFQSFDPTHRIYNYLLVHDYLGFYSSEIEERCRFKYPPFVRIVNIYIKHRERETVQRVANRYAEVLKLSLGARVFGPDEPLVARVQNLYIRRIMLKLEPDTSLKRIKDYLREVNVYLADEKILGNAIVYYDVDPG